MIWFTILLMTIMVFSSRYVFLSPRLPIKLNADAQKLLSYSTPAVLTAIWAPIVFLKEGSLDISVLNPYLISALLAALIAWKTKNVLVTTILSMTTFFLFKTFAGL
ncbi:branched-chain amino acid ABC transporter [Vibrio albus]|uniref:Branched-chain amino acid ABC transporter n=1 Tax=Vibrio albus TaxID=2200953 RepID=A0A2U3B6P3_9VIBR|nr:AzlD domain-containing protein [Vibrio albus]PWI32461.1 branched-chain amino acid ABC transporter [Vibrio albus]